MNDQHIEVFDGSQEADSDSCVLNNFFDVREESRTLHTLKDCQHNTIL